MQNKYLGDRHDFNKFLLLKTFCQNLRLGINWCLVEKDNSPNNDGNFAFTQQQRKLVDQSYLQETLSKIRQCGGTVKDIAKSGILDRSTLFYDEYIESGDARNEWFDKGTETLKASDIIFFDADNGLAPDGLSQNSKKAIKYIWMDEIASTLKNGQSVILYQHNGRNQKVTEQIYDRVNLFKANITNVDYKIITIRASNVVYYCLLLDTVDTDIVTRLDRFGPLFSYDKHD